jgi:hypothetical protein
MCFSQASIFDTIYLNGNFRSVNLSEFQKGLIAMEFSVLKSELSSTVPGEYLVLALPKINLFAYSLLDEDQKRLFEKSWRQSTLNLIHSKYHYLNLSEEQKDIIIEVMENTNGSDTLKITKHYPDFPKDAIMAVLDSTQLQLEEEQRKQIKLNFEKYITGSDVEKAKDTAFERHRLALVTDYSRKHLQKAKRKVLVKILMINSEDVKKVDEITNIYHARVQSSRKKEIARFYSQDSVLIAPINKLLVEYKHKRFELQPDLCVYWCLGADDSAETKEEEEEILQHLEYFKKTYDDILGRSLHPLKKNRANLDSKVNAARTPKRPGTVVNIVASSRIQSVDDIAELLLVQFK